MPNFDQVFSELQAKMGAALEVIAQHPEIAAQVRDAIEGAQAAAVTQAEVRADEARANALNQVILGVRQTLAAAAPDPEPGASGGTGGESGSSGGTGDTGGTGGDTGGTGGDGV